MQTSVWALGKMAQCYTVTDVMHKVCMVTEMAQCYNVTEVMQTSVWAHSDGTMLQI